jgi:ATP-dependent DNA helicase UvrD/PcrA
MPEFFSSENTPLPLSKRLSDQFNAKIYPLDYAKTLKSNHHAHAFKRFPRDGGLPHALEDLLRPHTDLGIPARSALNRAFDDLYRQFFVAYSRPQEVLLLVGLRKTLPGKEVSNVATGWVRNGECVWARKVPFVEI